MSDTTYTYDCHWCGVKGVQPDHRCAQADPPTADARRRLPIDRPCSACSAGDVEMKHHLHSPPFREGVDEEPSPQERAEMGVAEDFAKAQDACRRADEPTPEHVAIKSANAEYRRQWPHGRSNFVAWEAIKFAEEVASSAIREALAYQYRKLAELRRDNSDIHAANARWQDTCEGQEKLLAELRAQLEDAKLAETRRVASEAAESQLAAVREALVEIEASSYAGSPEPWKKAIAKVRQVLPSSAPAAEAHDARVAAKALRDAADEIPLWIGQHKTIKEWLDKRTDAIESRAAGKAGDQGK